MDHTQHIVYATTSNRITLAKKCRSGKLTRIAFGVYADSDWYRTLPPLARYKEKIRICGKLHPEVIIAGRSAAVLHGLSLIGSMDYPDKVEAIVPVGRRRFQSELMCLYGGKLNNKSHTVSEADLSYWHRSAFSDVKIQSVTDTLFFLMRYHSEAESLVALHSALRKRSEGETFVMKKSKHFAFPVCSQAAFDLCTELYSLIQKNKNTYGIAKARRVLFLATDRAESPGESITILYCYNFGLALPIINLTLLDSGGLFLGRVDLFWNRSGERIDRRIHTEVIKGRCCRVLQGKVDAGDTVIVEFDGDIKFTNEEIRAGKSEHQILRKEKNRENAIRRQEHGMIRIGWSEFYYPMSLFRKLIDGGVPTKRYGHRKFDVLL
jgi:hypothetical protein